MKRKKQIEERILKLEQDVFRLEGNTNSQYATDFEKKYWTTNLIPGIKARIDELKWVLGQI